MSEGLGLDHLEPTPLRDNFIRVHPVLPLTRAAELRFVHGVWQLSRSSELHRRYGAGQVEARTRPSLRRGQFLYYTDMHGTPVAFCGWVYLSSGKLAGVLESGRDLEDSEFDSGTCPLFYELIAPFGHGLAVIRTVRELFKGQTVPAIRSRVRAGRRLPPRVQYFRF